MKIIDLKNQMDAQFGAVGSRFGDVHAKFDAVDAKFDAVDAKFDAVDARFDAVDARFDAVDARLDAVDARLDAVDARFDAVDTRFDAVDTRFDAVDTRFDAVDAQFRDLRTLITAETQATRTHFDVIAEQLRSEIKLGLDRSMATAQQLAGITAINGQDHVTFARTLEDHEFRLKALESSGSEPT
jgi:septal ring factor EnvC (AmiA/AmiB activator)